MNDTDICQASKYALAPLYIVYIKKSHTNVLYNSFIQYPFFFLSRTGISSKF